MGSTPYRPIRPAPGHGTGDRQVRLMEYARFPPPPTPGLPARRAPGTRNRGRRCARPFVRRSRDRRKRNGRGPYAAAHGELGGGRSAVGRRVSAVRAARRGGHGPGVPGQDRGRPAARAQDGARGVRAGPGLRRALRPRDPERRPGALAVDRRGGGLLPGGRGPAVARHRVRRRAVAGGLGGRARAASGDRRPGAGCRAVRGARRRARRPAGAPGREAVQRAAAGHPPAADRLRHRARGGGRPGTPGPAR